jgi:hypothetical protein
METEWKNSLPFGLKAQTNNTLKLETWNLVRNQAVNIATHCEWFVRIKLRTWRQCETLSLYSTTYNNLFTKINSNNDTECKSTHYESTRYECYSQLSVVVSHASPSPKKYALHDHTGGTDIPRGDACLYLQAIVITVQARVSPTETWKGWLLYLPDWACANISVTDNYDFINYSSPICDVEYLKKKCYEQ